MTADEFRQQYDAYPWDPYHPLAVILTDGRREYVDMPEQVRLTPDELVITRRTDPRRPERYPYAQIARLIPLLELPADPGGISYAEFDPFIRRLLMAEPFQPFAIELRSGDRIELNERGGTVRAGRFVLVRADLPGSMIRVSYDQIARLVPKSDAVPV